jgi:hypothetical protein
MASSARQIAGNLSFEMIVPKAGGVVAGEVTPLVGRSAELRRLDAVLARAGEGADPRRAVAEGSAQAVDGGRTEPLRMPKPCHLCELGILANQAAVASFSP